MTFKVINISDPGTSTRHGGDDLDKIAQYLNGTDVIDPVVINTDTVVKSNRLIFRDLSDTFNINVITSPETQSGSLTIPTLNGNVTLLLDNDARLYDSRNPLTHTVTHQSGQSDEIPIDMLGLPADVNNSLLNATPTKHGLMPALPADGLAYLDGNGNWTYPSGTGILADGSITNAKLADETVTGIKIAPAAISNSEVAPGAAIAYSKLALTNAILNADISTSTTIDWTKISKVGSKLQDMADVNITGRGDQMLIKWDSATSKYVFYTPAAGGGAVIPDDNSVSTIKIQNLAVTTAKIADANVTTAKIANLAVTTALIADGNVSLAKLSSNSVDASKIVDGSIMNAEINTSAAIAWAKVSKSGSVITDMGNVSVSSPSTGQVLTYSAGTWVNQTPATPASSPDSADPRGPKTGSIVGGMSSSNDQVGLGYGLFGNANFENAINSGVDSTGAYSELTTTSTSQTFARIYHQDDNGGPFMGSLHPKMYFRVKFPTASSIRVFLGFTEESPVPNNQFTIMDSEIGFGMLIDTANVTNWQTVRSSGGTQTLDDWGSAPSSNTVYDIVLEATGSTWKATLNGTTRTYSTNIPASSDVLGFGIMCNTHTSAVRYMRLYYAYVTQDG
jgi:hypothetical protein